ncbi:MAG: hypothetical protein BAJALOKI1v1_250023 [Promethearchaeota archaeon]|nr:MAG: hypothetical protein BAJALOKI1v1_250023 [Candidatus Lokiarchaeota archaeon]
MINEEKRKRILIALFSIIVTYIGIMFLIFILDILRVITFDIDSSFVVFIAIFPSSLGSIAAALLATNEKNNKLSTQREEV